LFHVDCANAAVFNKTTANKIIVFFMIVFD
jgi:hypothetical protein